jgi:hypothetical protein
MLQLFLIFFGTGYEVLILLRILDEVWVRTPCSVVYRTPRRTLSQLIKYNFSGERKNHWPRRQNQTRRTTLLPVRGHFRKQMCDAVPLGRYGLRHTSCGHDSK